MRKIFVCFCLFLFVFSSTVSALTPEQKRVIDSGAYYFNVEDNSLVCSSQTTESGSNLDYRGDPVFNEAQMRAINENRPIYEQAAQEYDIPWQIIASIHSSETNLRRYNPGNGQGVYQFYNGDGGPYPTGDVSEAEFLRQTKFMADRIKNDFSQRTPIAENKILSSSDARPESVKDMFFSYNGRAGVYKNQAAALGYDKETEGYEGSPYVMNKADEQRDPNYNTTSWGQIKTDAGSISYPANQGYGSFIKYSALGGAGGSCTGNSSSIVEIARRELELGANEADGSYLKYTGGVEAQWCAYFASWVLNEAGKPFENGPLPAVSGIRSYAIDKGWYSEKSDSSFTPQPGDLVIYKEGLSPYPSHVNIVVEYDSSTSTITTIGGNESNKILEASISRNAAAISGFVRIP